MRSVVTCVLAVLALGVPVLAGAQQKSFTGPSGWSHQPSAVASGATRSIDTWKKGDQSVTVLVDASLPYADELALVRKNVADNGVHPATDRDFTCAGKHAHEVEMTLNGSTFRQVLIDDGAGQGSTRITYSRAQSAAAAPEVLSAITAYCAP